MALLLAGCPRYTLIEPQRTAIGDRYTVEPQIAWSAAGLGSSVIWTIDGPALQSIHFLNGVKDGEALIQAGERSKALLFHKDMTALEIQELVLDSLVAAGGQRIEPHDLRPVPFGEQKGFRFELTFVSSNGLEKAGLVVGSVLEEKLYLIVYTGARVHYFAKHKEDVERLIESIQLKL